MAIFILGFCILLRVLYQGYQGYTGSSHNQTVLGRDTHTRRKGDIIGIILRFKIWKIQYKALGTLIQMSPV
jgi:hypothetical protein